MTKIQTTGIYLVIIQSIEILFSNCNAAIHADTNRTCIKPAILDGVVGGLLVVQVAHHDLGTLQQDLPWLPSLQGRPRDRVYHLVRKKH